MTEKQQMTTQRLQNMTSIFTLLNIYDTVHI